jgi:hypothetical protein
MEVPTSRYKKELDNIQDLVGGSSTLTPPPSPDFTHVGTEAMSKVGTGCSVDSS